MYVCMYVCIYIYIYMYICIYIYIYIYMKRDRIKYYKTINLLHNTANQLSKKEIKIN